MAATPAAPTCSPQRPQRRRATWLVLCFAAAACCLARGLPCAAAAAEAISGDRTAVSDSGAASEKGAVLDAVSSDRTLGGGQGGGAYQLTSAISVEPVPAMPGAGESMSSQNTVLGLHGGAGAGRAGRDLLDHVVERVDRFARSHVVKVSLGQLARDLSGGDQREYTS